MSRTDLNDLNLKTEGGGGKREESGHLRIVNVFYLYFHVYLMITYIEILHLCSFSVATEPSAEQP